ncbi:hypothetical protein [Haloprofundus halobius]|uniref:hypothetical protein n=1 Tax=Haloprofundus halobius TaxID=2876194 RepID=UPI001CCCDCEF|nr:hypothetical protein [Haloprofundus halobius]
MITKNEIKRIINGEGQPESTNQAEEFDPHEHAKESLSDWSESASTFYYCELCQQVFVSFDVFSDHRMASDFEAATDGEDEFSDYKVLRAGDKIPKYARVGEIAPCKPLSPVKSGGTYFHATLIRSKTYDPANGIPSGTVEVLAGRCDDGIARSVSGTRKQEIVSIRCDVLKTYESEEGMSKDEIIEWAAEQVAEDDELLESESIRYLRVNGEKIEVRESESLLGRLFG